MGRRLRRSLTVIAGPMFSGKSEELIRLLTVRFEHARQKVQVFSPSVDTRSGQGKIAAKSKFNLSFPSQTVTGAEEITALVAKDTHVVAIDEAQFFDQGLVAVCAKLAREREVIVAGLPTDFRGEPFGPMPLLLALATEVKLLHACCAVCGNDADRTQRLVDGKPAHHDDPLILVGGAKEGYEARCLFHHEVRR
jgi:thymidine kinase